VTPRSIFSRRERLRIRASSWLSRLERGASEAERQDDADQEVSRIAVLSRLDGLWHAAICFVNGDGAATGLLWKRQFETCEEAEAVFGRAR
jgi:hypothetical protein